MKQETQKPHVKAIDYLRAVSILAVILIHTTTRTLEITGYKLESFGWTLFLNQLARFAVPLFFLISGFVLELNSDKYTNYFSYLKKRLSKVFVPYVFWSLIYYLFVYNQNHDNFIHVLLVGNASYQLYFIPTLLIFYLLFPILHNVYKFIANGYSLAVLGIIQMILMYRDYNIEQFKFADPIRISILVYFVFILGMWAAKNKDEILEFVFKTKLWLTAILGAMIFYVFEEGKLTYFSSYNIKAFYSQWRISVLIYTLVLGALLFYFFEKSKFRTIVFETLSKLSFFVFFIHVIVLEYVWKIGGKFVSNNGMFDLLFFGVVSGASFFVAFLLHKIPNLNKLTG